MNTTTTRTPYRATARNLATLALEQLGEPVTAWRGAIKATARRAWGGAYQLRASYFRPYGHHHYRHEEEAIYTGTSPAQALAAMLLRVIPTPDVLALRGEREHLFRAMLAAQDAGLLDSGTALAIAEASSTPLNFADMGEGDIAFWRAVLEAISTPEQAPEHAHQEGRQEAGRREPIAA